MIVCRFLLFLVVDCSLMLDYCSSLVLCCVSFVGCVVRVLLLYVVGVCYVLVRFVSRCVACYGLFKCACCCSDRGRWLFLALLFVVDCCS